MSEIVLKFNNSDRIGKVSAVDTSKVLVNVEDSRSISKVGVGNLVAILGSIESEYLIGITERITRNIRDELIEEDVMDTPMQMGPVAEDIMRVLLVGTYRTVHGDKTNVFKRGADSFPQIDRGCFLIDGGNLQRFMGMLGADFDESERLQLGHFVIDAEAKAIASGDKFFQRHASILGSTGSGKSWTVALILEKASMLKHSNIIVFDMHGEYTPLADPKKGFAKSYRVAGPGDLQNPSEDVIFLPYWLLNREEMLSMTVEHSDREAENQTSRFTKHVRELKAATLIASKHERILETFTVDSPIPYEMGDLIQRLSEDDTEMIPGAKPNTQKQGDWFGKLTRLIGRVQSKIEDRRYGFLFQPPKSAMSYDWLAGQLVKLFSSNSKNPGVKIIDFSEVPSDVLPVVTGTLARLLYDVQFWMREDKRTPFCIVCDEAHLYLPTRDDADAVERQALSTFERIAKEGRKYGVSLLVVSQRPSDVSRTILSQCNNFIVLRLTNDSDQSVVKRLMPDSMAGLTEIIPLLDTGEALMLGDAVLLPARIRLDKPRLSPTSGTREFWKEWGTREPDSHSIQEAVETLRRQTRPDA